MWRDDAHNLSTTASRRDLFRPGERDELVAVFGELGDRDPLCQPGDEGGGGMRGADEGAGRAGCEGRAGAFGMCKRVGQSMKQGRDDRAKR